MAFCTNYKGQLQNKLFLLHSALV